MVQIIRDDKHTIECWPEHLYIPHGSDNTWKAIQAKINLNAFISHMVQIIRRESKKKN